MAQATHFRVVPSGEIAGKMAFKSEYRHERDAMKCAERIVLASMSGSADVVRTKDRRVVVTYSWEQLPEVRRIGIVDVRYWAVEHRHETSHGLSDINASPDLESRWSALQSKKV